MDISIFDSIKSRFEDYYNKEFEDESDDDKENLNIKWDLVSILKSIKKKYDNKEISKDFYHEMVSMGLDILAENTGSHVDYEILEKLIPELLDCKIIDNSQAIHLKDNSPVSRWF